MTTGRVIRLLQDPPLDGATNMARDEVLLTRVGRLESPPTLRLYQWDPPTISLGYFQRYAEFEALPAPAGELPVVRRLTGGGAILHDRELTYSLTLPTGHPLLSSCPGRLYDLAHEAVTTCLRSLGLNVGRCGMTDDSTPRRGPFFCFARRHECDVLLGREKIAGSAQRRTRDAVLQHGSIILGNRFAQHPSVAGVPVFEEALPAVRSTIAGHFARALGERIEPGIWSESELSAAGELVGKYAGTEWLGRL